MSKNYAVFLMISVILSLKIITSKVENEQNQVKKLQNSDLKNSASHNEETPADIPTAEILLPIRRSGTSETKLNVAPCGGVQKKLANSLVKKGSAFSFIWEILIPESSGKCTVKISPGLDVEQNFTLLLPTDGSANEEGAFECGRIKGFESKEFVLPKDYECDGCILQWKWSTSQGDVYSCSDIIINGDSNTQCMGECQNGGACFNGRCTCLAGFEGEFCENEINSSSNAVFIILGILGIIGAAIGGYYFYNKYLGKGGDDWLIKSKDNKSKNDKREDLGKQDTDKRDMVYS